MNGSNKTALSKHASELSHCFDFANVRILHRDLTNTKQRKIIEALYIGTATKSCNDNTDYDKSVHSYSHLCK